MKILPVLEANSLQDRCNFGEPELSIFVVKITAAVFDFNSSGRLGREKILDQCDEQRSKRRRREGARQCIFWRDKYPVRHVSTKFPSPLDQIKCWLSKDLTFCGPLCQALGLRTVL